MIPAPPLAKSFRQILLWPVQLIPQGENAQIQRHWDYLEAASQAGKTPWKQISDEFSSSSDQFNEQRYREFVTFLPFAQRFLYGEAKRAGVESGFGRSPIFVFTRDDVKRVRVRFSTEGEPVELRVSHTDLYFFYDLDMAVLVVEIAGEDLSLQQVQDALYRFGRAYPSHWDPDGHGGHCPGKVEWLDQAGHVLAASDYEQKENYLNFVRDQRAPRVASHWEFLMHPLVQHYSDRSGDVRYREIEYQRMPLMAYIAFDDVNQLSRGDLIRLGLASHPGDSSTLPYSESFLRDFEQQHCYDRYWDSTGGRGWGNTRFVCTGQNFLVIGNADEPFFTARENGILSQFRHQYFLLFLIAHFQKGALLMLSDRMVLAISRLDIDDPESLKDFRRAIRDTLEIFLRFTHRYWFNAVSDQAVSRDIFSMMTRHLGSNDLHEKTRRRILDMTEYLEAEQLKQQADTVVRLTVVTVIGLVFSITSGLLGMNVIDATDSPPWFKLLYFAVALVPVCLLIFYTVKKSRRLSRFLDILSDEKAGSRERLRALRDVWSGETRD
jgi:hypothetical protein